MTEPNAINNTVKPIKRKGKIKKLFEAQGGRCFYCNCEMQLYRFTRKFPLPDNYATQDHIIPKSEGGTCAKKNLVAACSKCNSRRMSIPASDFKAMVLEGRV